MKLTKPFLQTDHTPYAFSSNNPSDSNLTNSENTKPTESSHLNASNKRHADFELLKQQIQKYMQLLNE